MGFTKKVKNAVTFVRNKLSGLVKAVGSLLSKKTTRKSRAKAVPVVQTAGKKMRARNLRGLKFYNSRKNTRKGKKAASRKRLHSGGGKSYAHKSKKARTGHSSRSRSPGKTSVPMNIDWPRPHGALVPMNIPLPQAYAPSVPMNIDWPRPAVKATSSRKRKPHRRH